MINVILFLFTFTATYLLFIKSYARYTVLNEPYPIIC